MRVRHVPDHVGEIALLPARAVDVERDRAAREMPVVARPDGSARSAPPARTTCRCPTAASSRACRSAGRGASCRGRPRSRTRARCASLGARRSRRACRSRRPARSRDGSSSSPADSAMRPTAGGTTGTIGVGRLGEEERRLLGRVAAHLLRVLGVVAADAIDVADRKAIARCRRSARRERPTSGMA